MLLYEGPPFWDDTPWINRMPNGGVHAGRWQEWFNASRYLCDGANESMLVAFSAGSAAWSAEQDSNEELTRQVMGAHVRLCMCACGALLRPW